MAEQVPLNVKVSIEGKEEFISLAGMIEELQKRVRELEERAAHATRALNAPVVKRVIAASLCDDPNCSCPQSS